MTIVHAMVDTASIDVELDTHQLNEVVANAVAEALGKVAGADFVATLDTRVIHLEEIIEGQVKRMLATIGRVNKLEETLAIKEDGMPYDPPYDDIRYENLIKRVTKLEDNLESRVEVLQRRQDQIRDKIGSGHEMKYEIAMQEIQRLNERVDSFCCIEDRCEEQTDEMQALVDKLNERVAQLEQRKCINPHCGAKADGGDGKCMYHSQDDLEAVE